LGTPAFVAAADADEHQPRRHAVAQLMHQQSLSCIEILGQERGEIAGHARAAAQNGADHEQRQPGDDDGA